jgi:hypothetical protein
MQSGECARQINKQGRGRNKLTSSGNAPARAYVNRFLLFQLLDLRVANQFRSGAAAFAHGFFVFLGELFVPRRQQLLPEVLLFLLCSWVGGSRPRVGNRVTNRQSMLQEVLHVSTYRFAQLLEKCESERKKWTS